MGKFDTAWSTGDLAKAVCDELVSNWLLREKPAFIREDREKKLTQIFAAAKLDGVSMATMNGLSVEMAVRSATQGEGWVDDFQKVLKGMLDQSKANDTTLQESEDMKQIRDQLVAAARVENPNREAPEESEGDRMGGRGRECFNCCQTGIALAGPVSDPSLAEKNAGQHTYHRTRLKGVAARWNPDHGFRFIKPRGGVDNVFCHFSAIVDCNVLREVYMIERA